MTFGRKKKDSRAPPRPTHGGRSRRGGIPGHLGEASSGPISRTAALYALHLHGYHGRRWSPPAISTPPEQNWRRLRWGHEPVAQHAVDDPGRDCRGCRDAVYPSNDACREHGRPHLRGGVDAPKAGELRNRPPKLRPHHTHPAPNLHVAPKVLPPLVGSLSPPLP